MKFAILFAMIGAVFAQERPAVTVWTRGNVKQVRNMFAPGVNVKVLDAQAERERDRDSGYVPPGERNALFRKVGIETKVAKMDELDKDMLVMGAREYSVREMRAQYPMLSEGEIKRLRNELGKRK